MKAQFQSNKVREAPRRSLHRGFFNFDKLKLCLPSFSRPDGFEIEREVLVATDAALVLPYDPVRDQVLLVEQFRSGPYVRGDQAAWTLEPIAGLVDPGETPETTAIREAIEEAGIEISRLEKIGNAYPSPGTSSEFYHLFVGLADLDGTQTATGVAQEGEDIRSHILPAQRLFEMCAQGSLRVLPLQTLSLWLELNRRRLRKGH